MNKIFRYRFSSILSILLDVSKLFYLDSFFGTQMNKIFRFLILIYLERDLQTLKESAPKMT